MYAVCMSLSFILPSTLYMHAHTRTHAYTHTYKHTPTCIHTNAHNHLHVDTSLTVGDSTVPSSVNGLPLPPRVRGTTAYVQFCQRLDISGVIQVRACTRLCYVS